ncbi:hypothetical protein PHMEG_00018371 [Phytophthora megakarya]|uniref:RxLR effector protein n=1 Tax=Phytophthora megakarya TaxID=4795 RepID=A0A225VUI7_9STRA|nr:hypothetical protein PHMEG_00018371 [Phytophthora megakarya]
MRFTYTAVVVIAATLCTGSVALPLTKDSKGMVEKAASPDVVDPMYTDGGRLLRRAEKYEEDDDALKEARGFDIKGLASKLSPTKAAIKAEQAAVKAAKNAAKVKEKIQSAVEYQHMIARAKQLIKD